MDFINSIYESISIYRGIVVCQTDEEMLIIETHMRDNDYHITYDHTNRDARVLLLKYDDFLKFTGTFDFIEDELKVQPYSYTDYTVIFISKCLHDRIDLSQICTIFRNLKLVAFLEI